MRVAACLLLLLVAGSAGSLEPRDLQGLRLLVEPVGQSLVVDGVDLRIQRAQGNDVPMLAQRIASRWRAQGDAVRSMQQRGWQMLARLDAGTSELIQWRGEGPTAELLHSSFDAQRPLQRTAAAPFRLPSQCVWGRVIQSRERAGLQVQRTAACRGTAREIRPMLRSLLLAAGWQLQESAGGTFELQRDALSGRVLFGEGDDGAGSVVVWLGTHAGVQGVP